MMEKKNLHNGHREKMRKKLVSDKADSFEDHELIEMLLYYCIPMKNTNEIAHKILNEYGSISMLMNADSKDMARRCSVTENTALLFTLVSELMKRCSREKWMQKKIIDSSDEAGDFAVSLLSYEKQECFYVMSLNSQNRLLNSTLISKGTVTETGVSSRIVVETALRYQAAKILLAHNHPGGRLWYSKADLTTTKSIIKILNLIDIEVMDHIIVANNDYISMADHGQIINRLKPEDE